MEEKKFYNFILSDKKPYFFKYKYPYFKKEINEYEQNGNTNSLKYFGKTLKELYSKKDNGEEFTPEELNFLIKYEKWYPAISTNCVMNNICKHIENTDFNIKQKVKTSSDFDYKTLMSDNFSINKKIYEKIKEEVDRTFKEWQEISKLNNKTKAARNFSSSFDLDKQIKFERDTACELLKQRLYDITCNEEQLTNHLIYLFYVDKPSYNKSTLWILVGKQIYENIFNRTKSFYFPIKDNNGDLKFLYENYQIKSIKIDDIKPIKLIEANNESDNEYTNENLE